MENNNSYNAPTETDGAPTKWDELAKEAGRFNNNEETGDRLDGTATEDAEAKGIGPEKALEANRDLYNDLAKKINITRAVSSKIRAEGKFAALGTDAIESLGQCLSVLRRCANGHETYEMVETEDGIVVPEHMLVPDSKGETSYSTMMKIIERGNEAFNKGIASGIIKEEDLDSSSLPKRDLEHDKSLVIKYGESEKGDEWLSLGNDTLVTDLESDVKYDNLSDIANSMHFIQIRQESNNNFFESLPKKVESLEQDIAQAEADLEKNNSLIEKEKGKSIFGALKRIFGRKKYEENMQRTKEVSDTLTRRIQELRNLRKTLDREAEQRKESSSDGETMSSLIAQAKEL